MTVPDIYNPPVSTYTSPLAGYEGQPPLSDEKNDDGKSLKNPDPTVRSPAYDAFPEPLDRGRRGGFDVHIYYYQTNAAHTAYARALHERIRREFPELRIYRFWDRPIGPHPVAMFEVNLFTPAQFGAFIPWLSVWRGPLSVLVHPNTVHGAGADDDPVAAVARERRDHTQRAIWLGERVPLDLTVFDTMATNRQATARGIADQANKSAS
ncbi:DOPA-like domain protein [Niveomyces insectorum RCEF 264]|uniref:DOPA-like domain protein n=1 Tax=Niveomyces insectorum RCEF 264 TaxID=1081102 RepID=A0A167VJA3_9HYPO|nr:DOPA-like domain protein [Niveomyces insectorum RCEF 264]